MNTRRIDQLALAAACVLSAASVGCRFTVGPQLQGSGVAKTEDRQVADFSEVQVEGAANIEIEIGPATSVTVTSDDNILPHVRTDVSGGRLRIHVDASYSSSLGVKVEVTTPSLTAFDGSGATSCRIDGVTGDRFELDLSGASSCRLAAEVDELDATLSGASRAELTGSATSLTVDCSGASRIEGADFPAAHVSAALSGASTALVAASETLTADASGASTVRYRGEPGKVTQDVSGASTIRAE